MDHLRPFPGLYDPRCDGIAQHWLLKSEFVVKDGIVELERKWNGKPLFFSQYKHG